MGVGPRRRGTRTADAHWWPAVHSRSPGLSPPPARPLAISVRLSRGLSRLRMRRRDMPVHRDRGVHHLNRAALSHLAHETNSANSGCTGIFPIVVLGTSPGDGAIAILKGAGWAGRPLRGTRSWA